MLKIGHRGAKAYAPENTIQSFSKAIDMGVDAVELDVRMTKDGALVVIHDEKVDKTTNGKGKVSELSLREVKKLETAKGEKIPTLKEALNFLDRKVKILIELKEEGYEKKVYDLIKNKGLNDNVIIVSFKEEALRNVRELDPEIETGFIYARFQKPLDKAFELKANYVLPLYHFTHTEDVEKAHDKGLKVIVWTINKKEKIEEFVKKGVDGITSDAPDIFF